MFYFRNQCDEKHRRDIIGKKTDIFDRNLIHQVWTSMSQVWRFIVIFFQQFNRISEIATIVHYLTDKLCLSWILHSVKSQETLDLLLFFSSAVEKKLMKYLLHNTGKSGFQFWWMFIISSWNITCAISFNVCSVQSIDFWNTFPVGGIQMIQNWQAFKEIASPLLEKMILSVFSFTRLATARQSSSEAAYRKEYSPRA